MNFDGLVKLLQSFPRQQLVFIGLGNEIRGDDCAGLILLEQIKQQPEFQGAHFIAAGTTPENYLQKILDHRPKAVIFIDTAHSSKPPGTIQMYQAKDLAPSDISTHAYSIEIIQNYLKKYSKIQFYYIGIAPADTSLGNRISAPMKKGIEQFFSHRSKKTV